MKEAENIKELISTQPYVKLLGIELIDAGPGWVHEKLTVNEKLLQPGVVHGGAIYSLADTGTAHAVLTLIYPAEWVTTVEQKINFLRAVRSGTLMCHSRVLHLGKRIGYCEAEVKSESGELIAKSTATLMRLERKGF
jgi:acyl-CoA thioesterase